MRVRDILEGVGKITSQNATKDVPVGGEYMNVKKLFPKQSKPKLQEFDIKIPDEGNTMGVPRAKMPQIKKQDYQEFLQYLKDNGVDFVQKKMPASSLKATQGEFSKTGVEKQLDKNLDAGGENTKPLIASSDNYIIDGHHRWLAALNTRGSLNVIQANIPGRKLLDLTVKFPNVYFKDIYEGYKIQLERDPNMYVLHIKDSKTGKRTEVRGKSGYESGGYDANDKLHQLLDKIGKSANISELINGETVTINPKHPDAANAQGAAHQAFNEEVKPSKPPKWKRSGPDGEIEIEFPTGRKFKIEKQYDENIRHRGEWKVLLWNDQSNDWEWGDTFSPKGYAKEMVIKMGQFDSQGKQVADYSHTFQFEAAVKENFADGKVKGKSRPGRVKRSGASCKGSVTDLRAKAKKYSGERGKMYHWCANMKAGKKK